MSGRAADAAEGQTPRALAGALDLLGSTLPALLLGVVLVVVSADVALRTLFATPIQEAHDIAILAFSGAVWFGVVGAMLHGEMIGVRALVDRLPPRLSRPVQALAHLAVIAIALAVLRAAAAQVATSRFTTFLALGWPKWIVAAALGAAMVAVILVQLLMLRRLLFARA